MLLQLIPELIKKLLSIFVLNHVFIKSRHGENREYNNAEFTGKITKEISEDPMSQHRGNRNQQ
jgi:hypothetical protein